MFKFRRQHRKERLLQDGFLPYEANELSRNKIGSLIMRKLRNERRALYRNYVKECKVHKVKPTVKGWKGVIADLYEEMGWVDKQGRPNPFARLREIWNSSTKDEKEHDSPGKRKKPRVTSTATFQQMLKKTREKETRKKLAPRLARGRVSQ